MTEIEVWRSHVVAIEGHVDLIDLVAMLGDHLGDSLRVSGGAGDS